MSSSTILNCRISVAHFNLSVHDWKKSKKDKNLFLYVQVIRSILPGKLLLCLILIFLRIYFLIRKNIGGKFQAAAT